MFMTYGEVCQAAKSRLIHQIANSNQPRVDRVISAEQVVKIADEVCPKSLGMLQSFLYNHKRLRQQKYSAMYIQEYIGAQPEERLMVLRDITRMLFQHLSNIVDAESVVIMRCTYSAVDVYGPVSKEIASCVQTTPRSLKH